MIHRYAGVQVTGQQDSPVVFSGLMAFACGGRVACRLSAFSAVT